VIYAAASRRSEARRRDDLYFTAVTQDMSPQRAACGCRCADDSSDAFDAPTLMLLPPIRFDARRHGKERLRRYFYYRATLLFFV